jgi:signal transduction histidine kinase
LKKEIDIRHQLETELIQISEREHRRIGQDLHDGICQELAGIRYSLEAISKQMRNSSPHKSRLTHLTEGVERAIHHTRLLSRGLAPLELENGDLQNALRELAENAATLFQIDCQFELIGRPGQFEIEKATNLFRIAQEALQNATKHAQPTQILIKLDLSGPNGDGEISVTDNGHGSKPNGNGHGMGLKIMNKRANILGGQLLVEPSEPAGTCVRCIFPK